MSANIPIGVRRRRRSDATWRPSSRCKTPLLPWGGVYRGLDGARPFFQTLGELTAAIPVPGEFIPAGDDIVLTGRLRGHARVTGAVIDPAIAHVLTVRHGRIVRFTAYIDTPTMLAALGADADS